MQCGHRNLAPKLAMSQGPPVSSRTIGGGGGGAVGSCSLVPGADPKVVVALCAICSRILELLQEKEKDLLPYAPQHFASQRTSGGYSGTPVGTSGKRTAIEDFEILKPISRGAHGRVYLARKKATQVRHSSFSFCLAPWSAGNGRSRNSEQAPLQDLYAIKVLRKDDLIRKNLVQNVKKERDILSSTNNPFVVRLFYSFTSRNNCYLVMEYLSGGDLFSLLQTMGCFDEDVARSYAAEAVLALECECVVRAAGGRLRSPLNLRRFLHRCRLSPERDYPP